MSNFHEQAGYFLSEASMGVEFRQLSQADCADYDVEEGIVIDEAITICYQRTGGHAVDHFGEPLMVYGVTKEVPDNHYSRDTPPESDIVELGDFKRLDEAVLCALTAVLADRIESAKMAAEADDF